MLLKVCLRVICGDLVVCSVGVGGFAIMVLFVNNAYGKLLCVGGVGYVLWVACFVAFGLEYMCGLGCGHCLV